MDMNSYVFEVIVHDRLDELRAGAERSRRSFEAWTAASRRLRDVVGHAVMRLRPPRRTVPRHSLSARAEGRRS